MIWILGAVLLAVLLAAYFKGVKNHKSWGTPVLILCILGIFALAVYSFGFRTRLPDVKDRIQSDAAGQQGIAERVGRALSGHVAPGSRILLVTDYGRNERGGPFHYFHTAWQQGLSKGLGHDKWEEVAILGPRVVVQTAESMTEALAEYEEGIDAIVSFVGLPADLEQMSIYALDNPPKVVACFPANADRAVIRGWLEKGLVTAVVIGQETYTPGDLP